MCLLSMQTNENDDTRAPLQLIFKYRVGVVVLRVRVRAICFLHPETTIQACYNHNIWNRSIFNHSLAHYSEGCARISYKEREIQKERKAGRNKDSLGVLGDWPVVASRVWRGGKGAPWRGGPPRPASSLLVLREELRSWVRAPGSIEAHRGSDACVP